MKNLYDIKTIKKIVTENGFRFSKSLGQNFITKDSVCKRMAQECITSDGIIEIGPGIGTLTCELAERFKKVVSIEIDNRLIPILKENLSDFKNIEIIHNDILKTDLNEVIKNNFLGCKKISVCANLPYYITTEIIMYILENEFDIDSIVIMLQKEAAERICAEPGTRLCGAISLGIRYFGEPEILFGVNKNCFIPMPSVDSSVMRIKIRKRTDIKNRDNFFKIVRAAFSQRRKNILNSLSFGLKLPKDCISKILDSTGIESNSRAENLSFNDFIILSEEIKV